MSSKWPQWSVSLTLSCRRSGDNGVFMLHYNVAAETTIQFKRLNTEQKFENLNVFLLQKKKITALTNGHNSFKNI